MRHAQLIFAMAGWVAFLGVVLSSPEQTANADGGGGPAGTLACEGDIAPLGGDGSVDVVDLLELLAQWGTCPDCSGTAEPNDACGSFFVLPGVDSSGIDQTRVWAGSTMVEGDVDLFRFEANETDDTCSCCDGGICLDEDFLIEVTLTVPIDATGPYLFRADATCTTDTAGAVSVAPGISATISFWVDGSCGGADDYTFYILVAGDSGTAESCIPYTLTYSMTPGCE